MDDQDNHTGNGAEMRGRAPVESVVDQALVVPPPRRIESMDDALDEIQTLRALLLVALDRVSALEADLEEGTATDSVTGLLAEAGLMTVSRWAQAWSKREGQPYAAVVITIPKLEATLDNEGRAAWEEAVRAVGATIAGLLRAVDVIGRIGESAYVVLCLKMSREGCDVVLERLRLGLGQRGWQPHIAVVWTDSDGETWRVWEAVESILDDPRTHSNKVITI